MRARVVYLMLVVQFGRLGFWHLYVHQTAWALHTCSPSSWSSHRLWTPSRSFQLTFSFFACMMTLCETPALFFFYSLLHPPVACSSSWERKLTVVDRHECFFAKIHDAHLHFSFWLSHTRCPFIIKWPPSHDGWDCQLCFLTMDAMPLPLTHQHFCWLYVDMSC